MCRKGVARAFHVLVKRMSDAYQTPCAQPEYELLCVVREQCPPHTMPSTLLHATPLHNASPVTSPSASPGAEDEKNPFLMALGKRVAGLRARRGMTRKSLAAAAGVSERHLANMEYGVGNASVLVLLQVADALQSSISELVGDITTSSPEWLMIRDMLAACDEAALQRVRVAVGGLLATGGAQGNLAQPGATGPSNRIALIGLRGAGKSTLGRMLAEDLGFVFIEVSREIEKFAGCSVAEIQALYGVNAYRRYERRALEQAIQTHSQAVIATPGGLVSDAATFNQLLAHCTAVWLQADPQDHMGRVAAQGDLRPMAASTEAMDDLKGILAGRAAFYSKAQFKVNTSAQPLQPTFAALRAVVRQALGLTV